jgi:hypothetical protein
VHGDKRPAKQPPPSLEPDADVRQRYLPRRRRSVAHQSAMLEFDGSENYRASQTSYIGV